jgi:hypothetical protein
MSNKENLKVAFPHMPLASEAPSCPAGADFESWAIREREIDYVAMDSKGNVWSIQNPNAWKRKTGSNGEQILIRRTPNLVMKASDFRAMTGEVRSKKKYESNLDSIF